MVVAAAGAVDHKQVVAEVEKRFASFEATPGPKPQAAQFGKGGAKVVHRELEQAHLTLALEGVPQSDLSLFSLQVFTNILGGGMSSRLFQEVREKRGLCYSIYTFHAPYTDTGFFGLYTGTDPADAPEMMEVVVDIMNDSVETLTEAEIARAKAQMKAGLLMALESCSSARRAAGPACAGLWPAADGGGAGGPDRRRQRRIDPRCGACAAFAEPPCSCRIGQRQGSGHGGVFCGRIDPGACQGAAALGAAHGPLRPGKHHHGPVSPAIQWTRRPRAARQRAVAARAADVGLPAVGAFARDPAATTSRPGSRSGRRMTSPGPASAAACGAIPRTSPRTAPIPS